MTDDRNKVVVESSLALLSHPEAAKKLNGAASDAGKGAKLTQISDAAGTVVWRSGDKQVPLNEETAAFTTYILEFSGPVRIQNFHDAARKTGFFGGGPDLQYSLMHFRRPGNPIGKDYLQIQQQEDSEDKAAAAAAEPAEEPTTTAEQPVAEQPTATQAEEEPAAEEPAPPPLPKPPRPQAAPYGKPSVTQLTNPNDFTGVSVLDDDHKILETAIQPSGDGAQDFYGDFGMITPDFGYKYYRARGKTQKDVVKAIQAFLKTETKKFMTSQ